MVDSLQPGSLAVGVDSDNILNGRLIVWPRLAFWIWQATAYMYALLVRISQPGLLDMAGVFCLPVLCACTDHTPWPIGYGRGLHTTTLCLYRSHSLAYWIQQAFAYLCFVLVPITQPGLLDKAGICIPMLCACANYSAWPIGYGRLLQRLALLAC